MTRPAALRLAAYLGVVAMFVFVVWLMDRDQTRDDARRCVTAWETRTDIRIAIAGAATVPVEALIAVLPDADPAQVAAYRTETSARIDEATAELPDPDCDLDAARHTLGD